MLRPHAWWHRAACPARSQVQIIRAWANASAAAHYNALQAAACAAGVQEMRAEFAGMRAYLEAARALGEPWLHSLNTAHRRLRALVAETEALLAAHQILFEAYPEYNPVLVRPASAIDAFVRATWGTAGVACQCGCQCAWLQAPGHRQTFSRSGGV